MIPRTLSGMVRKFVPCVEKDVGHIGGLVTQQPATRREATFKAILCSPTRSTYTTSYV